VYTLNNIIKFQEDFATNHKQINSFLFAPTSEFDSLQQIQYPLLLTDIESCNQKEQEENFVFRVIICDQIKPDLRNEQDVLSDCKLILNDFVAYFRQTKFTEYFSIETDFSADSFTKGFADDTAGWDCKITFKKYLDLDLCGIPMIGTPSYPNPLLVTIYDQNNNIVTQLVAGQQYQVIVATGIDSGNSTTSYTIQVIDI
jgi:hypothetical protein